MGRKKRDKEREMHKGRVARELGRKREGENRKREGKNRK